MPYIEDKWVYAVNIKISIKLFIFLTNLKFLICIKYYSLFIFGANKIITETTL